MSKKDYQAIARALYQARTVPGPGLDAFPVSAEEMRSDIAGRLAEVLQAGNPRFDRSRFLEACETGTCKGMKA